MKEKTIKYRVAPTHKLYKRFPIDMLRYDGAYPASEREAHKISNTFYAEGGTSEPKPEELQIEVVGTFNGAPQDARWRSFGWHVTHVYDERIGQWVPYDTQRIYK